MTPVTVVAGRYQFEPGPGQWGVRTARDRARAARTVEVRIEPFAGEAPGGRLARLAKVAALRDPGLNPLRDFGPVDGVDAWFAVTDPRSTTALLDALPVAGANAGPLLANALSLIARLADHGFFPPLEALRFEGGDVMISALDLIDDDNEAAGAARSADGAAPALARAHGENSSGDRRLQVLLRRWSTSASLTPRVALSQLAAAGLRPTAARAPLEPMFHGREGEMHRLEDALRDLAEAGRGAVIAITGPAGSGKTRLLDELRFRARCEGLMLAEASSADPGPFYGATASLLRQLMSFVSPAFLWRHGNDLKRIVPEMDPGATPGPEAAEPESQRLRLLDSAARLVREMAAARPVVLRLADLHRATPPSIDLMRPIAVEIARNSSSFSTLLLLEIRTPETASDPIATLLADLRRAPGFAEIALGPLDEHAALAIAAEQLPGRRLSRREKDDLLTAGAGIPAQLLTSVQELLGPRAAAHARRVGANDDGQAVVRALHVLGRPASEELIAAVADLPMVTGTLDTLMAAARVRRSVATGAPEFELVEAKFAETIFASATEVDKAALHARAARALASVGVASAERLMHLEASHDEPGIAAAALAGAQAARDARAWGEAADFLRRALGVTRTPAARRPLLAEAAALATSAGEPAEAARLYDELEGIEKSRNPETILGRAGALAGAGELEAALSALARMERTPRLETHLKARAATLRSRLLLKRGTVNQAEAEAERACRLLARLPERPGAALDRADAGSARAASALARGATEQALAHQREALAQLGADSPPERRVRALALLGSIHFGNGDLDLALERWQEALALAEGERHSLGTAEIISNIGAVHFNRGKVEEARRLFARSLEISERVGDARGAAVALSNLGLAAAAAGNFEEGRGLLSQALSAAIALGDRTNQGFTEMTLGWLECESGNRATGITRLRRAARLAVARKDRRSEAMARALLAEALVRASRGEAGVSEARVACRLARVIGSAEAEGIALRAMALAAGARKKLSEAGRLFARSIAALERAGNLLERGRSEAEQARVMGTRSKADAVREPGDALAANPASAIEESAPTPRDAATPDALVDLLASTISDFGSAAPSTLLHRLAHAAGATDARWVEANLAEDIPEDALALPGGRGFVVFTGRESDHSAPMPVLMALMRALDVAVRAAHANAETSAATLTGDVGADSGAPSFRLMAPGVSDAGFGGMVGQTPAMTRLFALLSRVAANELPVLIEGESGTGKERVARAIHEASSRRAGRFVAIDCAAIPESLIESELFGHRKGAFTGASVDRHGLFEEAQGGTVLLDEVANIPLPIQAKLLRVLQEREVRRVGETTVRPIDARLVAATNRPLDEEVRSGRFREDLYFRLNVIEVHLVPLRERSDDIPLLVAHLLGRMASPPPRIERDALEALSSYDWPGNVRELDNELRRAQVLAGNGVIRRSDLSPRLLAGLREERAQRAANATATTITLREAVLALERRMLERALAITGGHRGRTARVLGLSHQGLINKLKTHRLLGAGEAGREGTKGSPPREPRSR